MKCEICSKHDAETAINVLQDGEDRELYVCRECARQEKIRRQKKSQRTRKAADLAPGLSISISRIEGGSGGEDEAPPFIKALMDVMNGMVSDMEKAVANIPGKTAKAADFHNFPLDRIEKEYRIGSAFHLEGLYLLGELAAVRRAVAALDMKLDGISADGIVDAGHVYTFSYSGTIAQARRVAMDIMAQERNARIRLFNEMPRVLGDSICRALAILKNCRMLSPAELFDLLSPLRIVAREGMLDGATGEDVDRWLDEIDLTSSEDSLEQDERDRIDSERADAMNRRFEDIVLNERAEERFL